MRVRFRDGILLFVLIGMWIGLTACSELVTATPPPTLQVVRVTYPPALRPVSEALQTCVEANPHIALILNEAPVSASLDQVADLTLRMGFPGSSSVFVAAAAAIGQEEIVVVANRANSLNRLSVEDLAGLLTGRLENWGQIGGPDAPVEVWVYPQGNELRDVFDGAVLSGESITTMAMVAPDPEAMLEAVAGSEGAIGYIPKAWISAEVRQVRVDEIQAKLIQPVLVLAESEPWDAPRTLLACLQTGEGQKEIQARYLPWEEK
ncbi:MAG: hypothetical protein EHM70_19305 [Chloroflexota bacterium]|nr:MAG: hypothetical protein EHM70_19305 [Chloroflexota bacterium]